MDLTTWESIRSKLVLPASGNCIVIGLAAILVMVAVVAGSNVFDTATASTFELSSEGEPSEEALPEEAPEQTVFVHVSGAVENPGLVELDQGARVADAVKAAGGFSEEAATSSVNLARVLSDGEQIFVAALQEQEGGAPAAAADAGTVPAAQAQSRVNINTASANELESLPGIGPATAQKIIAYREEHGSFASSEDLTLVQGIGEKKLAAILELVCV